MTVAVAATSRPGLLPLASTGRQLELHLPPWTLIPLVIACGAAGLAMIVTLLPSPPPKDLEEFVHEPPSLPRLSPLTLILLWLLLIAAVVGAFLLVWQIALQSALPRAIEVLRLQTAAPSPPVPGHLRAAIRIPGAERGLTFTLAIAAAIVTGLAALVIASNQPWHTLAEWLRRGRRKRGSVQDLSAVVSTGLRELEAGEDARRAVIACYRRCEAVIAARRRRRLAAETPREFVADALAALELPRTDVESLLSIFERARFSDLIITDAQRDAAARAFRAIHSALGTRAIHEPGP
jgi:Domain of unknown function (DUF4129)